MKPIRALNHSTTLKRLAYQASWSLKRVDYSALDKHLNALPDNTTFLCVGANDGLSGNPIAPYVFLKGWRGMFVEPNPHAFYRLQKNYTHNNIQLMNCAVSDLNGSRKFYYLKKNDELPPGYDQIGSFNAAHILAHEHMFPGLAGYMTSNQVECLTLNDLMSYYQFIRPRVLLVDAEGYDDVIIKQLDGIGKPDLVIYEHQHLTTAAAWETENFLFERGYNLTICEGDTIAARGAAL